MVKADLETILRRNGKELKIATGTVGDETGCINIRITGDNAQFIKEGAILAFRNGKSMVFQDHMRLEIDRWGKITEEDVKIGEIKLSENFSDTEYEIKSNYRSERSDR